MITSNSNQHLKKSCLLGLIKLLARKRLTIADSYSNSNSDYIAPLSPLKPSSEKECKPPQTSLPHQNHSPHPIESHSATMPSLHQSSLAGEQKSNQIIFLDTFHIHLMHKSTNRSIARSLFIMLEQRSRLRLLMLSQKRGELACYFIETMRRGRDCSALFES